MFFCGYFFCWEELNWLKKERKEHINVKVEK